MTTRQISYRLKTDGKAELQRDAAAVGQALEDAGNRGEAAFGRTNRVLQNTGELTDRQIAGYRKLAQAAREAELAEEAQARINGTLGVGGGRNWRPSDIIGGDGAPGGLSRGQRAGRLNLARQGADIFTTASMGMDPGMIAIQQGPQILDALAQSGIRATPAMLALGGAVTVLAGGVIALTVAGMQYEAQQNRVDAATQGLGRTLRVTAEEFDRYARVGADVGEVSVKAATDMGIAYVSTGKIGGNVLGDLIGLTKRYALTTGQDVGAATQDLAKHFSTGSKGVEELNDKLHFLSAAELEHIKNLYESGRGAEAQKAAVDHLNGSLIDAKTATSDWDAVLDRLGTTASNVWRKIGHAIAIAMDGGTDGEQLTALIERRNNLLARGLDAQAADLKTEIDATRTRIANDAKRQLDAANNERDVNRDAIVKRYRDPKIQALTDKQNERKNYLSLGGKDGDDTIRKIDAEISALKAGYTSAADQAAKLQQAHDKAVRAGQKASRERATEARKDKRDLEEQIRLEGQRADHANDNARRLAQAMGNQDALDYLERQGRLQEDINRWVREGLSLEQARVNARAQMSAEMQAESDRLRKERSNPEGFVSSQDALAKAMAGVKIQPYSQLREYGEQLRVTTGDAFHDGLMAGMTSGSFFDVFKDRLRYAAASGLADSLTSGLFGSRDGSGTVGLIQKALKFVPKFAGGTNFAPGGLSIVGEYGPEVVDLPRGSKVHTAAATQAMVQGMATRAANVSAGEVVNFHYSPTFHLQGTADEIRALRGEIDRDRKSFKANAVQAYADAKARRQI
jgi:hypothetical protein